MNTMDRFTKTEPGKIMLSVILGLGLATLFRKVCNDKKCINFKGPVLSEFEDKVYQYGDKCYKYGVQANKCDTNKKEILVE
jgi:hypothetical protein|tara:strand:- start:1582 stop:1824 length:243 start_codon:yes stop_codon:yes gene_type:complete